MVKYINKELVLNLIPERPVDSHKGTFGKIINFAGSANYIGAAYLSSISALRSGAGFLTLACPQRIISSIASIAPEITFLEIENCDLNRVVENYNVISIGCGLSTATNAVKVTKNVLSLRKDSQQLVIDADAINIIAKNEFEYSIKNSVITPHPQELSRLLSVKLEDILENKEKYARIASQKYECITVLKGHNTIITDGDEIIINTTGNSALAKAGSGDVLTGIIASFLAQGVTPLNSAIIGTYIHGLSGDLASDDLTQYCVLASDVIDYIPSTFNYLLSEE